MRSEMSRGGRPRWKVEMFEVGVRQHLHLTLLNPRFDAFDMHWGHRCHVPCTRKLGNCEWCKLFKPWRPELYISAVPVGGGVPGILHITHHMFVNETRFRLSPNLRGEEVDLWREGDSPRSRRRIKMTGFCPHPLQLPHALDCERFIEQVYQGQLIDGLAGKGEVPA